MGLEERDMTPSLVLAPDRRALIGVVHLRATPGAPRFGGSVQELLQFAVSDARVLVGGGCDAIIVENFGDAPFFPEHVPAETIATMTRALDAVMAVAEGLPVGVNVLRNDARSGLGICAATGASFLRVNVHTGAAVTDQGLLQGKAAETLRERERLCPGVALLCDLHVKHATPLGNADIGEAAADTTRRGLADAVIVTGSATGEAPHRQEISRVREAVGNTPVLIGSGLTETNARGLLELANGAIVGTYLKRDGMIGEPVDETRVLRMRQALDVIR